MGHCYVHTFCLIYMSWNNHNNFCTNSPTSSFVLHILAEKIQWFLLTCAPALNFFFSCCCLSLCHFPMSFSHTLTGFHFTAFQRLHLLYSSKNLSQQHAHARARGVNTDRGPASSMSFTHAHKHTVTSFDRLFNIELGKSKNKQQHALHFWNPNITYKTCKSLFTPYKMEATKPDDRCLLTLLVLLKEMFVNPLDCWY